MQKKCNYCGKEYKARNNESKYCSRSCANKGKNHANVKCSCDVCGKELEVVYSRYIKNKHNYCSVECTNIGKTLFNRGKNNPRYDRVVVECEVCHKKREINKYKYEHQAHFYCSNKCKIEGYKKIFIGEKNPYYGKQHNKETKIKISKANTGNIAWNKGYKVPWKTDEEREKDRSIYGEEYLKWRQAVYERDNYTCQCCGNNKGGSFNAHHLDGYAWCKEKRLDISNGITLCKNCHIEFHKLYGKGNNTKEQFEEFIKIIKSA